jgi:4-hydroxy-3-methylbut-2-enyl diphosphate reductase
MAERRVIVVHPHGFCAGVARALAAAEAALARFPRPIYGLHELVHNEHVVADLEARGVRFVQRVEEAPPGATLLFSAHGVAPAVRAAAAGRDLRVVDATCPYVAKVHDEVRRFAAGGGTVFCIGHHGHAEVEGVAGEAPGQVIVVATPEEAQQAQPADPARVAVVTQTTLSPERADQVRAALRERFPKLREPVRADICHATRDRQEAARALAQAADLVLVLGSETSSNSRRLVETVERAGGRARLVGSRPALAGVPLADVRTLGVTSGASTPESFLLDVLADLRPLGFTAVEHLHAVPERPRAFRPVLVDPARNLL